MQFLSQVSQQDLAELTEVSKPDIEALEDKETTNEEGEVSLDEVSKQEVQEAEVNTEDTEPSNS